jgi:large subunit ribosomal protein L9
MKVLLQTDMPKLGYLGDVVEVAEGYARNYLLPERKAVVPTEANIKSLEAERVRQIEERAMAHKALVKAADKARGAEVTISVTANEQGHLYGSVSEADVALAIQQSGHNVQIKHIRMSEHIRTLGIYPVKLHFADDIDDVEIKVWVVRPEGQSSESQPEETSQPDEQA